MAKAYEVQNSTAWWCIWRYIASSIPRFSHVHSQEYTSIVLHAWVCFVVSLKVWVLYNFYLTNILQTSVFNLSCANITLTSVIRPGSNRVIHHMTRGQRSSKNISSILSQEQKHNARLMFSISVCLFVVRYALIYSMACSLEHCLPYCLLLKNRALSDCLRIKGTVTKYTHTFLNDVLYSK